MDPTGYPDGLNGYAAMMSDPIGMRDATGFASIGLGDMPPTFDPMGFPAGGDPGMLAKNAITPGQPASPECPPDDSGEVDPQNQSLIDGAMIVIQAIKDGKISNPAIAAQGLSNAAGMLAFAGLSPDQINALVNSDAHIVTTNANNAFLQAANQAQEANNIANDASPLHSVVLQGLLSSFNGAGNFGIWAINQGLSLGTWGAMGAGTSYALTSSDWSNGLASSEYGWHQTDEVVGGAGLLLAAASPVIAPVITSLLPGAPATSVTPAASGYTVGGIPIESPEAQPLLDQLFEDMNLNGPDPSRGGLGPLEPPSEPDWPPPLPWWRNN